MYFFRLGILFLILFLAACAPQPTKEVPAEFKLGQKYFHKTCSNCHGSDAMGKHTQAPRLIDAEFLEPNFTDDDFRETIINGINKMPPQRNKVNDEEIKEIIKYLRYSQKAADLVVEEDMDSEEMLDEDESFESE